MDEKNLKRMLDLSLKIWKMPLSDFRVGELQSLMKICGTMQEPQDFDLEIIENAYNRIINKL